MITATDQRNWFHSQLEMAHREPDGEELAWLNMARKQSLRAIDTLATANRKHEAWRYSHTEQIFKQKFQAAGTSGGQFRFEGARNSLLQDGDSYRLVFVNGQYSPHLSVMTGLPVGATVCSMRAALTAVPHLVADWFARIAGPGENVFSALNTALMNDGLFIYLDKGVTLSQPIEVVCIGAGDHVTNQVGMIQIRNLIVLCEDSGATLIERFICDSDVQYFNNNLSEIVIAETASLTHYRIQEESPRAYHMGSLHIAQYRDSHYENTSIALGAMWARSEVNVKFKQANADCDLAGLYCTGDQQLMGTHLDVQHQVSACKSVENFKGILYGKGQAVFDGHVLVDRDAQHSDAFMNNNNLLLSRDAEIDSKPQLEIYADDVKCGHGTTVGQIDEEQVYYMRSRGVEGNTARRMLSIGFARDIIDRLHIPELHNYSLDRLASRLQTALNQQAQPL